MLAYSHPSRCEAQADSSAVLSCCSKENEHKQQLFFFSLSFTSFNYYYL